MYRVLALNRTSVLLAELTDYATVVHQVNSNREEDAFNQQMHYQCWAVFGHGCMQCTIGGTHERPWCFDRGCERWNCICACQRKVDC